MGLNIHNLSNLPDTVDGRDYYIYLLDYGWIEPLTEALKANFHTMARMAAESRSVVIAGLDPIHFANDVFSWHSINGQDGEDILPAIMITNLHPRYFKDHIHQHSEGSDSKRDEKLLLLPLKKTL